MATRLRLAVVAYDDEKQSADVYFEALQQLFKDDEDISFINHWGTIQDVIKFIHNNGNNVLNEIDRIILLDQAFSQSVSATDMTEEFVTLEQVMENNGIKHPYLAWLTINQECYDICKTNKTPKGQTVLSYDRVRIIRLKSDRNGEIDTNSLIDGIDGTSDRTGLTIRKDFKSREERAMDALNEHLTSTKNKGRKTKTLNDMSALLRQRYGLDPNTVDKSSKRTIGKGKKEKQQKSNRAIKTYEDLESSASKITDNLKERNKERNSLDNEYIEEADNKTFSNVDKQNAVEQIENDIKELYSRTNLNLETKFFTKHKTFIIVVGGTKGSGVSSAVANMAECFACFNQKTLIINVSDNDDITKLFKDFELKYQQGNRQQVLHNRVKAKDNKGRYIPVTSKIDLISDLGETQASYNDAERVNELNTFLVCDHQEHNVILIDAGENLFNVIKKIGKINLTSLIFVTDNRIQSIKNLNQLGKTKQQLSGELTTLFKQQPLGLIVNKCTNHDFIDNQHRMTEKNLNHFLPELKPPFDRLCLLGKIPYYRDWNLQNVIHQRACYFNDEIFEIMKIITERSVVS